jgi:predicted DNA-binding transcriptional regulator YafY
VRGQYATGNVERDRLKLFLRQWQILRELAMNPYVTTTTMVRRYGVTERTIRRDLHILQAAGFEIYREYGDRGSPRLWRLSRSAKQSRELLAAMST